MNQDVNDKMVSLHLHVRQYEKEILKSLSEKLGCSQSMIVREAITVLFTAHGEQEAREKREAEMKEEMRQNGIRRKKEREKQQGEHNEKNK